MLSRSSWRAARVLRAARGINEQSQPPAWKQQPSASSKLPGQCTCFTRHLSRSRPVSEAPSLSEVKIVDVKGKGREQEDLVGTGTQSSDHLSSDRLEGSSTDVLRSNDAHATARSTSSKTRQGKKKSIDPEQAEAWLMTALANSTPLQARETWNSYSALPLDRRKTVPLHVYSQLSKVQKTLQLKRRGSLWSRLSSIYEVWQEREDIPIEEVRDTIRMLRYWFEQKEVVHSSREFAQARNLCCDIAKLLNPYSKLDLPELDSLVDLINDYGTTGSLKDVGATLAEAFLRDGSGRYSDFTRPEAMSRIYTKVISRLALRLEVQQALELTNAAWKDGVHVDLEECKRNVLVALHVLETEDPDRAEKYMERLEAQGSDKDESYPTHDWLIQYKTVRESINQLSADEQDSYIVALLGYEGNEEKVALALASVRMRYLLSSPIRPLINESGRKEHDPTSVVKTLYDAIQAMKIYDEYLAKGYRADRELYRLAKMSRRRTETQSTFSSSLREAALLRVQEERDKQVRNFKKKWLAPRPITAHFQSAKEAIASPELEDASHANAQHDEHGESLPHLSEEDVAVAPSRNRNIYANADPGQILHLSIELGDNELARAVLPVVMEDPTFTWTRYDDDRALTLLKLLLRDASRPDITASDRRDASRVASSFYVRWQESLAKDPEAYVEHRSNVQRYMRSPTFLLLRLLAHHRDSESYAEAMQVLLQDPSIRLTAQHIRVFLNHIFKSSRRLSDIAFKLFIVKGLLARSSKYQHLKAELERMVSDPEICQMSVKDQAYLHWCEKILRHIRHLDITPRLSLLEDVLDMYEGYMDIDHDSLAAYIVIELRKSGVTPAGGLQDLLAQNRLRASSSAPRDLLKLLEEGSLLAAATRAEEEIRGLLATDMRTEANHVWELFVAVSEERPDGNLTQVQEAIEAMRYLLQPASQSPAEGHLPTVTTENMSSSVASAEKEIAKDRVATAAHATLSVPSEKLPQRQDFLGEFFSDSRHTMPQQQEEWKKNSIPEVQEWSEAAVGFRNAVGPEKVQVAAASMTASHTEEKEELAAAPFFENSYNRGSSTTSALLHGTASAQAYSTLASQAGPSSTFDSQQSSPSILRELSQLPQQFADLTMEQVLALKRRCEIEMDAIRKRDEQVLAARRMALSRADASRWQGWQEFQATPWY